MVIDLPGHLTESYEVTMGNVPEEVQIIPEDFSKDDQELVGQLTGPINNYILQLNSILSGQASITAEFKTYSISGGSSLTISSSITQPFGIQLVGWRNLSNTSEELAVAPAIQWSTDGAGNLKIRPIGLETDNKYSINIMIFAGVS